MSDEQNSDYLKLNHNKTEKVYKLQGGLMKMPDGEMKRTKMFDILEMPLDDCSDLEFTESEVRRIRMHVMKMKTGIQAMVPLLCSGPVKCPFRYRCPIVDRDIRTPDGKDIDFHNQNSSKFPILRQCLFEQELLAFQSKRYIEEYDVDVESPTEMGVVNKLAELDVYEMRATMVLAHGDDKGEGLDLLKQQTSSVSMSGEEIKRMELHPAFELKERIHKIRQNLLQSMVGTRREQYKQAAALKKQEFGDPSTASASLLEKIQKLEADQKDTIVDAEYEEN